MDEWMKLECCRYTFQCSIFLMRNKRVFEAQAESKSEKFMSNHSFMLKDFTIRFLSFEMLLIGDLKFLMTLLGQHNQSQCENACFVI